MFGKLIVGHLIAGVMAQGRTGNVAVVLLPAGRA